MAHCNLLLFSNKDCPPLMSHFLLWMESRMGKVDLLLPPPPYVQGTHSAEVCLSLQAAAPADCCCVNQCFTPWCTWKKNTNPDKKVNANWGRQTTRCSPACSPTPWIHSAWCYPSAWPSPALIADKCLSDSRDQHRQSSAQSDVGLS